MDTKTILIVAGGGLALAGAYLVLKASAENGGNGGNGNGGNGGNGVFFTLTIETFEYGGSGYTEPAGTVVQASGTVLQVYAYPTSGAFYGWNLDGVDVGSENPIPITFDKKHALTAVFT